jgi:hypothetical protein
MILNTQSFFIIQTQMLQMFFLYTLSLTTQQQLAIDLIHLFLITINTIYEILY